MPRLRDTPPTRDELSAAYGFLVPEAFARVMNGVHAWAHARAQEECAAPEEKTSDPYEAMYRLTELLGWFPGGPVWDVLAIGKVPHRDSGYGGTPPEFMCFGDMGVDGAQYGYVVHAPELNATEYPVAHFCAMDSEGVTKTGRDTADGVARMLAQHWRYLCDPEYSEGDEPPDPRPFAAFAHATGVEWSPESDLDELWDKDTSPDSVPHGWMWAKTLDGVGVLAPRDAFRREGQGLTARVYGMRLPAMESEIRGAEQDLAEGFPASALFRARELWWDMWTDDMAGQPASRLMAAAYERLSRPLLARITIERAERVAEMNRRTATRFDKEFREIREKASRARAWMEERRLKDEGSS